jgi:hypothetical protein
MKGQRITASVAAVAVVALVLATVLSGCGGDTTSTTTAAPTTTAPAATTTVAPTTTEAPTTAAAPTTTDAPTTTIALPEIIPGVATVLYENERFGFSLYQPEDATIQTAGFEAYLPLTQTPAAAVVLPEALFAGTNLSEAGVYVGASSVPGAVSGWNQPAPGSAETAFGITDINGVSWAAFTSSEGAAGNVYEQRVYRTVRDGICFEIVQLLHSLQVGNYPEGSVVEFDREKFEGYLDAIARSFRFAES